MNENQNENSSRPGWPLAVCLGIFVAGLLFLGSRAADFPLPEAYNTQTGTVLWALSGTNTSNTNGAGFEVGANLYHTFHLRTVCTNSASVFLDRSLDGVRWIPFSTNTSSATATNEVLMIGKWVYVRGRFTGTNASAAVLYLGGR